MSVIPFVKNIDATHILSGYLASGTPHAYPIAGTLKAVPGNLIDQYIP